jgi:hypothetical protein
MFPEHRPLAARCPRESGVEIMRTTTAYFAGVGTVAAALVAGLGGGLLFSNIVAPHQPKYATEPTKLEQRMADRTIASAPSEPAPSAQPAAATPVVAATPAPQSEPQTPTPQVAAAPPVDQKTSVESSATEPKSANSEAGAAQATPSAKTEPSSRATASSPRDAFAKARDSDMKSRDADIKSRDADTKRAATEKRRAERRQQWADRRRDRQPREQELEAVERSVREVTEPRQAFMDEPVRMDVPRIRLFGDD